LPWDGRIHASTKTKRQGDNTWKLARNIAPALVEQVKAELRAAMAAPAPAATPPAPAFPPTATDVAAQASFPPPATPYPGVALPLAPAAPPAVPPTAPTPPAAVEPPTGGAADLSQLTFPQLVQVVTRMQNAGHITFTEVLGVCQELGIPALPLLSSRSDLIPAAYRKMEAIWLPRCTPA
jgi:hypothetical protein